MFDQVKDMSPSLKIKCHFFSPKKKKEVEYFFKKIKLCLNIEFRIIL